MDVTVDMSQDGLEGLAERIERMADSLQGACDDAAQEIADYAADIASASSPVDTGMLSSSIHTQRTADGVDVVCSAPYAAFVEFGTGLGSPAANATTLQAMSDAGWVINLKGRGESGWQFPTRDGGWATTHGQSGKGFMGQGAEAARNVAGGIVAEHVEGAMRR